MAQMADPVKKIQAGVLNVNYLDVRPADGPVAVLRQGFPYDFHAYDELVDDLPSAGCRCICVDTKGNRFVSPDILVQVSRLLWMQTF
jgi:hypothetical protein